MQKKVEETWTSKSSNVKLFRHLWMQTKEWMEVQYKTEMGVINHGTADNNPGEDEVAINHGEEEVVLEEVRIIEVENKFFLMEKIIIKSQKV
jgi:hypothetical protein